MDIQDSKLSDDNDCLARCLDGDAEAYRTLVERYQRALVSWLTGRLRDRNSAEDVAQEAFVRAWFALKRFQTGKPFFPWLCGIAHQVERETRRSQRRRDHHHQTAGRQHESPAPASSEMDEPDLTLRAGIDTLPANLRSVVLLRYYGPCSCKETARRLDMPLGSVTKCLSRAHAQLRQFLRNQSGDSSHNDQEVRQ